MKVDTQLVIGLGGELGAGKTTAARYLAKMYGFRVFGFGELVRDFLVKQGEDTTRENLQAFGERLLETLSFEGLSEALRRRIIGNALCVVDGIRHTRVADCFRNWYGRRFRLLFVTASPGVRVLRINERRKFSDERDIDPATLRELEQHSTEQGVRDLCRLADYILSTERSLSATYEDLDLWISMLMRDLHIID